MEKKTNKAKLEIFKFFEEIRFIARLQPMTKLEIIMTYQQLLQKYAYQGIFACRIHICDKKRFKILRFSWKIQKKIEK